MGRPGYDGNGHFVRYGDQRAEEITKEQACSYYHTYLVDGDTRWRVSDLEDDGAYSDIYERSRKELIQRLKREGLKVRISEGGVAYISSS